jgi:hypothetical protein
LKEEKKENVENNFKNLVANGYQSVGYGPERIVKIKSYPKDY